MTILHFSDTHLGFNDLEAFNEDVKHKEELISVQTNAKIKTEAEIVNGEKELETFKTKEVELKKELDNLQKIKEEKTKHQNELAILKTSLESLSEQQRKLNSEYQALKIKHKELIDLEPLKIDYELLQVKLKVEQSKKENQLKKEGLEKEQTQLIEQYTKAKNDIGTLENEVQGYDRLKQKLQANSSFSSLLQIQIKENESHIKTLNAQIAGEQKLIDTTKAQLAKIETIGKDSNCPTCTRPLYEEYDKVILSLSKTIETIQKEKIEKHQKELARLEATKTTLDTQKENLDKEQQELSKQISIIEVKQKDLEKVRAYFQEVEAKEKKNKEALEELVKFGSYDVKYHQELLIKEQNLKQQYELSQKLQTEVERITIVTKDLVEIKNSIESKTKLIVAKSNEIKAIMYDETMHVQKELSFIRFQKEKENLVAIINNFKVQIAFLEGELKALQTSLDTNKTHQEKLSIKQQDLSDYEKIKVEEWR